MDEKEPIGSALAFGLISFGILIDLIQILLTVIMIGFILNPVIDILAAGIFWLLLYHHGNNTLSRRKVAFGVAAVIGFISGIDVLPEWTIFAIYTVVMDHVQIGMEQNPDDNPGPPTRQSWTRRL